MIVLLLVYLHVKLDNYFLILHRDKLISSDYYHKINARSIQVYTGLYRTYYTLRDRYDIAFMSSFSTNK